MLRYVTAVQGSLAGNTALFTSLASKRKIFECGTTKCLQTRKEIDVTQQLANVSHLGGFTALHMTQDWGTLSRSLLSLRRKHKIRRWRVHVVSNLIHVNEVLLGASRAGNASRKHCLFNTRMWVNATQQLTTVSHLDL